MEGSDLLMADFAASITPSSFLYRRNVYLTNPYPTFQTTLIAKLVLTEDNFNFDLAQEDGSDFRLVDGVDTLRMWVAHWSKEDEHAVLFFKLQNIGGGASVSFNAYWGNPNIEMNSEPDTLGFDFYEDFETTPLSSSKWSGDLNRTLTDYGYLIYNNFTSTTSPLLNRNSWVIEAGLYCGWTSNLNWYEAARSMGFEFLGTENPFVISLVNLDKIKHNATVPAGVTTETLTKNFGGLEAASINDVYISYNEPEDLIRVKLLNRNNFSDVVHTIPRKVEGDTRLDNIRILPREGGGSYGGAQPTYISWLVIRNYDDKSIILLDGSDLYVSHEEVQHASQDFRDYGNDLTSTFYEHETDFGGNAYRLSNNLHDSNTNVWISNENATTEDEIHLTIHFGWSYNQLVSKKQIHYDSGHIYYYNASKLSDKDLDYMGRNFWHSTTTSGWAAINFNPSKNIGAFRIKSHSEEDSRPKDYVFYGSNDTPVFIDEGDYIRPPDDYISSAIKLIEGTFINTDEWQSIKVPGNTKFKYFILDVLNTYGGEVIKIQEWRMYSSVSIKEPRHPTQLRLHPATYGNYMSNFPKEIKFEGSLNGYDWDILIPWTSTYTPFHVHYTGQGYWQYYTFVNDRGFWSFRLSCRGNWGAIDGKIIIGEWALHELASEDYIYRILAGDTNNIQQVWLPDGYTFGDNNKIIYMANEKLNSVVNDKLIDSKDLPDYYEDLTVV
jgi:hypothetical protein